jgi:hypothetical protein
METRPTRSVAVDFEGRGRVISTTSRFVKDFYEGLLADPDLTSRVALTAHELLENTAKYSSDGVTHMQVAVSERGGLSYVQIRTRNRVTPERLAQLAHFIDEISAATDPVALYYEFIARTAETPEGSGLGLARIRAEGEMELAYTIEEDQVIIVAEASAQLKEGS